MRTMPKQRDRFLEQGYVVVHALITGKVLKELDRMANRLLDVEFKTMFGWESVRDAN